MNGRGALQHADANAGTAQGNGRREAADPGTRDDDVANGAQRLPNLSTNAVSSRLNSCGCSIITK